MVDVGARLAGTFLARCAARSLTPDDRLRILDLDPTAVDDEAPGEPLGTLHERLVSTAERRTRGAWYTPAWLADTLVARTVDGPVTVADPACGGGVFLLAAAQRLQALGAEPGVIVADLLWGCDVDPLAVAVCEAELWLWSASHGSATVAGARLVVGDPLLDTTIPAVEVVVGNPPFLGQLKKGTSVDADRRRLLGDRWGAAVRPYTDASWLFLLAAVEAVRPGGRVSLVLPQSVLGARDAAVIRDRIDRGAELVDCWVDDGSTFDAAVDVCAPVLQRTTETRRGNDWLAALGERAGTPLVDLRVTAGVLGDRATVLAGFRDEYYGLVDAVHEDGDGPQLVTSGAVDPLRLRAHPVRFAKRRWHRPTIDIDRTVGRARRWVAAQSAPKLVVASQTRVLEAVVDEEGAMVAGVPALAVLPDDADDLWLLAAAIHAPAASAWMLQRTIGTGLSADSCRPTSDLVSGMPLPGDEGPWRAAAVVARALAAGADRWEEFAELADAAFCVDDPGLRNWWLGRLPLR